MKGEPTQRFLGEPQTSQSERTSRLIKLVGGIVAGCLAAAAVVLSVVDQRCTPTMPSGSGVSVSPLAPSANTAPEGPWDSGSSSSLPGLTAGAFDPSRCVMVHFPPRTFRAKPDMRFVCTEADPREVALQLRIRVVQSSGGEVTNAMDEWARLGWHELAAASIVRWACCPKPLRIELPADQAECAPLAPTLERLAEAFVARADTITALHAFEATAECLHRTGAPAYKYKSGPQSGGQVAFRKFMRRNGR